MSKRKIVVVAGLSGIGKSTLIEIARRQFEFESLQAGDLIRREREECGDKPVSHDNMREESIDDNQALLISSFIRRAPKEGSIVLDCHTIIDTPDGLVEISPSVFSAIGVSHFIILIDNVERIAMRRSSDTLRKRPIRSNEELAEHQERSVLAAYRISLALGVPMHVLHLRECTNFAALLDKLLNSSTK